MIGRITFIVFLAVFAAFMATWLFRAARRSRFQAALRRRLGAEQRADAGALLRTDGEGDAESYFAKLAATSGFGWTPAVFMTRMLAAGGAGVVVGAILGGAPLGFLLGLVGLVVLPFAAKRAHAQRMAQCDQQMPQALEVMSLALRAGHPLPSALAVAAAEAPSPIADELRRAVEEHELGRPIGDVLVAFGKRLEGSEAVHTFVVAVLVLQQTGGNLIAVIERIVENARARAQYHAKLRALTSEGRSSAKMLGLLPGAFLVLAALADPTYLHTLLRTGAGNMILILTGALWLTGVLWTRRLVRTDR